MQSSTIHSYTSAIKVVLVCDGYQRDDQKVLLNTIIKACKLENDTVKTRLLISCNLLELLLFVLDRKYSESQPYLSILYKSIFFSGYYSLMWIGESSNNGSSLYQSKEYSHQYK